MPAQLQHMLLHLQAMTTFSITTPERKWPCLMPSLTSVHVLAQTSLGIFPFTMLTCLQSGRKHFNKPSWVILRCVPLLTSSSLVGQITARRFLAPYIFTDNLMRPSPSNMALSSLERPCLFLHSERETILHQLHQFDQRITKSQLLTHGCIFWPGISKAIEEVVHQCETCTQFQAQNAATSLTPTPTLSCPWQMCTSDIFTPEGADYIICGDFYLKMILIQCLPSGQIKTTKLVLLLKEMFSEHGIPEILCSDNGP